MKALNGIYHGVENIYKIAFHEIDKGFRNTPLLGSNI